MKQFIPAVLAVAMFVTPVGAIAGEPPAPGSGHNVMFMSMAGKLQLTQSQQQAWGQIMSQTHQQLEQLHTQARAKVLGSLTPAHRALLAQVVGSMAIAPNPDEDAAARQLTAALSPGEAQAVVSTHMALMQQAHALLEASHQKLMSVLTPSQRAQVPGPGAEHMGMPGPGFGFKGMEGRGSPTAGEILLHLSGEGPEFHTMMHFEHN